MTTTKLSRRELKALKSAIVTLRSESYPDVRIAIELGIEFGVPEHEVIDLMY